MRTTNQEKKTAKVKLPLGLRNDAPRHKEDGPL
jgi:hypothetical protein